MESLSRRAFSLLLVGSLMTNNGTAEAFRIYAIRPSVAPVAITSIFREQVLAARLVNAYGAAIYIWSLLRNFNPSSPRSNLAELPSRPHWTRNFRRPGEHLLPVLEKVMWI